MAFRGTFDYSLDAKNRLTIPAKFRASLSEGVVLAKGIERCVQVWTPSGFEAYTASALQGVHPLSADARRTSLNASTAGLAWYSRTCVAPSNSFA